MLIETNDIRLYTTNSRIEITNKTNKSTFYVQLEGIGEQADRSVRQMRDFSAPLTL